MMLGALGTGLLASAVTALISWLASLTLGLSPLTLLAVGAAAALFQKFFIDRYPTGRIYEGLPDLFFHIHSPSVNDYPWRWMLRGAVSFLLAVFGGIAGPEGAVVELPYAAGLQLRARSARWFEHRRRTDSAMALAAGISAVFGAPFAAILVPTEMGMGGRTIHIAIASITAFCAMSYLSGMVPGSSMDLSGALYGFGLGDWREWLAMLTIAALGSILSLALVHFSRYSRENLFQLYRSRGWVRLFAGGVLLYFVVTAHRAGMAPSAKLLEDVLWSRVPAPQTLLLFSTRFLILAILVSTFGSVGIFWPLFAMGGFLGFLVNFYVFGDLPGFAAASGLIGASALWGAILGTPVAAAVLVYEVTHNLALLLPCLLAGFLSREAYKLLRGRRLIDAGLESRGLKIHEGRSVSVLESIVVSDAMVSDHQAVQENEAVSDLQDRIVKSRYPFFPVLRKDGQYLGLLTLDLVQDAWHTDQTVTAHSSLSKLLEVKDLLYRAGTRPTPTVLQTQRLSEVSPLFEAHPCLPVLNAESQVIGLLLVQNVRQAYDREVVRRSLELAALSPGV